MAMDIRNLCSTGTRSIRLRRHYPTLKAENSPAATRTRRPMWKQLWRKLLKEKRKMMMATESSVHLGVPYDKHTYSQNFDEGLAWDEPDILSRSFSARFADPSRIFFKKMSDVKDFLDI